MSLLARRLTPPQTQVKATNIPVPGAPSFQYINGRLIAYTDNQENYIVKGYNINDIVYSIVRLITDKAKVAPWGVYKIEDEQAYKSLKAEQSKKVHDIVKIAKLQTKALVPVKEPGKWGELLMYPNSQQTGNEFVAFGIAMKLLTGNKYISGRRLTGGANAGIPNELWVEPSQYMNIYADKGWPVRPTGYELTILPEIKFTPEEVIHEKYFNPNYDINGVQLYGQAPLKAGLKRLQKSNLQLTAEAASWDNEGVKGVFAFKVQPGQVDGETMQSAVVDPFTENMRTSWQGAKNRGKMGVSGYDLSWIPVGLNSEEMELIESGLVDLRMLCNIFGGVPTQLLNDPVNKTYNTFKEAEVSLTSRCVLPELCSTRDAMTRKAIEHWGLPKGQVIDFDMSVFSELQADVKEVAAWTSQLIAISPNEQRELCSLAALPDPEMSEPWVNTLGRVPLSERQMNEVDNALNDGTDDEENI